MASNRLRGSYARAGQRIVQRRQGWVVVPANDDAKPYDALGQPKGFRADASRTNKCTCAKYNLIDLTNLTKGGDAAATLSVASNPSMISSAKFAKVATNGKVYRLDNSSGALPATASSGVSGNTNKHSVRALVGGGSGTIGLSNAAGQQEFEAGEPRLIKQENVTPDSSSVGWQIQANAGEVIDFLFCEMVEVVALPDDIIVASYAAMTDTTALDVLQLGPVAFGGLNPANFKLVLAENADDLTDLVGSTTTIDAQDFASGTGGFVAAGSAVAVDVSGELQITGASNSTVASKSYTITPGEFFRVSVAGRRGTAGSAGARIGNAFNATTYGEFSYSSFTKALRSVIFKASSANLVLTLGYGATGLTTFHDDVLVEQLTVAADRSVAAQHPVVIGTLERVLVAPGSSLAGYTGFSESNYLEVPYNAAFNFGTSDIHEACWIIGETTGACVFTDRGTPGGQRRYQISQNESGFLQAIIADTGAVQFVSTFQINDGHPHFIELVRKGTTAVEIRCDGESQTFAGTSKSVTDTGTATLRIGLSAEGTNPAVGFIIAVVLVQSYAPTAEESARMYEQMLPYFTEGKYADPFNIGQGFPFIGYDPTLPLIIVTEAAQDYLGTNGIRAELTDGTSISRAQNYVGSSNVPGLYLQIAGVSTGSTGEGNSVGAGQYVKVATRFKSGANRVRSEISSGSEVATTYIRPPLKDLLLGASRSSSANALKGYLKRVTVYQADLNNSELDALVGDFPLWTDGDSYNANAVGLANTLRSLTGLLLINTAISGSTLQQTADRVEADVGYHASTLIVWDGSANGYNTVSEYVDQYDRIIAALGHDRYLILPPVTPSGGDPFISNQIWALMQERLDETRLLDPMPALLSLAISPGDDADVAAGCVPASLMLDTVHLTQAALTAVGNAVVDDLQSRGWI